ncbi:MAG: hypothetical protein KDB03_13970 [Planctomycetales bacterium]|nr:hypothetical protein [Planctomycetales bacterium]
MRRSSNVFRTSLWFCHVSLGLALLSGCSSFGQGKMLKQLQTENERLLSEFRQQRDQLGVLKQQNQLLASRLEESEKLLARQATTESGDRLSRLNNPPYYSSPGGLPTGQGGLSKNYAPRSPSNSGNSDLRWQPLHKSP